MDHQHNSHAHSESWNHLAEDFSEHLELESRLNADSRSRTIERVAAALSQTPELILDLGSGTGADSVALAQRFTAAEVHAFDISAELLERVRHTAKSAGCEDRVSTHLVDLNVDWTALLPRSADLVWASLSIHHLNDPAAGMRRALESLQPGGALVMVELTGETTVSSTNSVNNNPQLESIMALSRPSQHARPAASWTQLLASVGFTQVSHSECDLTVSAETRDGASYIERQLQSTRSQLEAELSEEDLAAIDAALAEARTGSSPLTLTTPRSVWIATKPGTN